MGGYLVELIVRKIDRFFDIFLLFGKITKFMSIISMCKLGGVQTVSVLFEVCVIFRRSPKPITFCLATMSVGIWTLLIALMPTVSSNNFG